jgi:N-acetylmuramoyl-L-alanine amidase
VKIIDNKVEGARYVPTTKKGGVIVPKYIVMHATVGYTTDGDVATLSTSDRPASIHNVIGRDGAVVQIVPYNIKAWHAGPSKWNSDVSLNDCSIGIELSNIEWLAIRADGTYEDEYNNVIQPNGTFANGRRATASSPSEWPRYNHDRLGSHAFAWEPYTKATLETLDELIPALFAAYPSLQEVVQHQWVDTRTGRTDPGPQFPMARYTRWNRNKNAVPGPRLATFVSTLQLPTDPGLWVLKLEPVPAPIQVPSPDAEAVHAPPTPKPVEPAPKAVDDSKFEAEQPSFLQKVWGVLTAWPTWK